jgi:hypothetical protein
MSPSDLSDAPRPRADQPSETAPKRLPVMLDDAMLDLLCPMHLRLDATGHVVHAGPTVHKLCAATGQGPVTGQRFLELFELRRPREVDTMQGLCAEVGAKLHLRLRDAAQTGTKAVVVRTAGEGAGTEGAVVNLSFGISLVEAVRRYKVSAADFAATDLAIELLYLVEAKSAAMEASRTLNQRLQGAMIAAEEQAFTDTLTGLKNRRALDHILDRLVDYAIDFTLMHLDLDFFKSVNDTMGHAAGDRVLPQATAFCSRWRASSSPRRATTTPSRASAGTSSCLSSTRPCRRRGSWRYRNASSSGWKCRSPTATSTPASPRASGTVPSGLEIRSSWGHEPLLGRAPAGAAHSGIPWSCKPTMEKSEWTDGRIRRLRQSWNS